MMMKIKMPPKGSYLLSFSDLDEVILSDDAFELENRTTVPRLMAKRHGRMRSLIDSKFMPDEALR
jgi:hypothetical protein